FGNVIGRKAHFRVEADDHFTNEFIVLLGRTSKGRKGTSLGQIRKLFEDADPEWLKDCVQSGLASGEGLKWAVRDAIFKSEAIKEEGRNCMNKVICELESPLTLGELGLRLGVAEGKLRRLFTRGILPEPGRFMGKRIFSEADVTEVRVA